MIRQEKHDDHEQVDLIQFLHQQRISKMKIQVRFEIFPKISIIRFLDLFVITPPIEHFFDASSRLRREQFFKVIFINNRYILFHSHIPVNSARTYSHWQCPYSECTGYARSSSMF